MRIKRRAFKKLIYIFDAVLLLLTLLFATACNFDNCSFVGKGSDEPIAPDKPESEITKIADFANGASPDFHSANGYKNNDSFFGCYWSNNNVTFGDGQMKLSLTDGGDRYYGGEYRSNAEYGHGYYSVSMKPLRMDGVISSFFTYTNRPWDEIDIEFLGDDTTKVQFNYYTSGVGGHEYVYELGFDASEEFHTYGFEWLDDCIIWYVDGKAVYKATEDIPVTNAKIMMNLWNVNTEGNESLKDWAGVFTGEGLPGSAYYEWIGFDPAEKEGSGADDGEKIPEGGEVIQGAEVTKPDSGVYKLADFSYGGASGFRAANGWSNGGMFGCAWSNGNVAFADKKMTLTLSESNNSYYGGEYRSDASYGKGYYSVRMKPLKMDGVISSFFTYTGPSDGTRWDEIDIEFLGDDTTTVQFNYYTDGVGGHEYVYELGFDASEEFHTYGFEWRDDCIIWYVDGRAVYKATKDIPITDARIMANLWNVNTQNNPDLIDWAGVFTGEGLPGSAYYEWIGFNAL